MRNLYIITLVILGMTTPAYAEQIEATVYSLTVDGQGQEIGTIAFEDTDDGLLVTEDFANLPTGPHGIHIHENGDCGFTTVDGTKVLGGAAGGHYDPHKTGKHTGPNTNGHKGDLPVLNVNERGSVKASFYLQGVTTSDFAGRAVIIHDGGDNYKDTPQPLGGGGDRIACGILKAQP